MEESSSLIFKVLCGCGRLSVSSVTISINHSLRRSIQEQSTDAIHIFVFIPVRNNVFSPPDCAKLIYEV